MNRAWYRRTWLLALAATTCCPASSQLFAQDSVAAESHIAGVARSLTAFVERERTQKAIPAIAMALVDGHRVVWARGFGWADSLANMRATAATVFRVGSVSKLFTDLAIMRLVEKGKLDLDASVERYLPDFHPHNPFGGVITIRELTSHRAGLTREPPVGNYFDDANPSLAATVASLNGTSLVYKPGTHTKYSNAGVAVLGYLLEQTQGESFYPYLKRAVLDPMGLTRSAFQPLPALQGALAKAYMWTLDGRRFEAPVFQLGMGPCGSMYTTVLDLGRFIGLLFDRRATNDTTRVIAPATLDAMWKPQFGSPGDSTGYGIGFGIGRLDGHRSIGHDGAIYGFATSLLALPDDSLGVVVVGTLDGMNAVTDHIAETALRMMLAARAGQNLPAVAQTFPLTKPEAISLTGRYSTKTDSVDLEEFEGRLYLTRTRGGVRTELRRVERTKAEALAQRTGVLRQRTKAGGSGQRAELIGDDLLAYGARLTALGDGRIIVGHDTARRVPTTAYRAVAAATPAPHTPSEDHAGLIGEYGWDHDVLYIREKDGKLNALIEWFFEYPLERVSRDVYRFPKYGLYDGQEIVFQRDADGAATLAVTATVPFKRRPLPADNDAVNFRIDPVKPVAELRSAALVARPPVEEGTFRKADLVELRSLDSTIKYDIRYATSNNFMGTPFYSSAHAFMQRPAAQAVMRASARLRPLGYGLLVHDAYRPWYVTKMFWDGTPPDKHIFVADPLQGSRHNRGCAVDITLYDLKTGAPVRMTGGYDEMSDRSYPLYPGGTSAQRWHRDLLRRAMDAEGFSVYEAEWWHFDYGDWRSYPIGTVTFEQLIAAR